jgi:hypothetical protein
MRVFACYVVSKLQRHRCLTFGTLRFRTNNAQTDSYIFIYIDKDKSEQQPKLHVDGTFVLESQIYRAQQVVAV